MATFSFGHRAVVVRLQELHLIVDSSRKREESGRAGFLGIAPPCRSSPPPHQDACRQQAVANQAIWLGAIYLLSSWNIFPLQDRDLELICRDFNDNRFRFINLIR